MSEKRRAPIEVLEALAEAVTVARERGWTLPTNVEPAHDAYRAATATLRTRASVDAEMGRIVRSSITRGLGVACSTIDELARLCSEPTADEPDAESIQERHERMNTAGIGKMFDTLGKKWSKEREPSPLVDQDLASDEPEACGCEEAEALKLEVTRLLTLTESSCAPNTLEWRQMVDDLRGRLARIRCLTSTYSSAEPCSALAAIRKECEGAP